jgi:hypothetical protein
MTIALQHVERSRAAGGGSFEARQSRVLLDSHYQLVDVYY